MDNTMVKSDKAGCCGIVPPGMTSGQKTILGASVFFLLVFVYMVAKTLLAQVVALPAVPGGTYGKLIPPLAFAVLYFVYARGFKSTLFLVAFLWIYCWLAEECSIHTGFPFGHYYYSDALGKKLDVVPVLLGLNYFWLLVFPTYFISNLIAQGTFFGAGKGLGKLLFTALIGSILISGMDMAIDPLDATRLHEWVWTKNNYTGYYGIPYCNYIGYVIVMTPLFFIYGLADRKFGAKPLGPINVGIAAIPLCFFFLEIILYGMPAPAGVFLVACFTMGLPLLLAIDKLIKCFNSEPGVPVSK
jgi:uncharacterized membrane protein